MLDVIIALLPAAVASVIIFGIKSVFVMLTCVIAAVVSEFLFNLICKKEQTVSDLSACVTGLILAMNLPATLPLWQAALGSVFAIVVVKCLFGGIGQNFANPAITGRIFLFLSFSGTMGEFYYPTPASDAVDVTAGATPLALFGSEEMPALLDLFLGRHGGSLGETCALALLIGGVYLVLRGVITWHTPVVYIATVFVLSLCFTGDANMAVQHVLTGGLMLGAIFMATDYATTPNTMWGKVVFGLGCGIITVLIRQFGSYPEGVSFSILLMNILTPYIERWTRTKPFGGAKA